MTAGDMMSLSRSADGTRLLAPPGGNNSSNILSLCIGRNGEISLLLNDLSRDDSSVELRKNNEMVTKTLLRLTTDYGDVDDILDIAQVEPLHKLIKDYRKKLAKFTERKGLGQFMMQGRIMKKMDVASNAVSLKLAEIDRLLKQTALDRLKAKRKSIFTELMEEILRENCEETNHRTLSRTNSLIQRRQKSAIDHASIKSSEVRSRLSNDSSIIRDDEKRKMLAMLRMGEVVVRPLLGDVQHRLISGAGNDESEHAVPDSACGQTVSTYPIVSTPDPNKPGQMIIDNHGHPINDKFCINVYENRIISCVTDGCGGRDPPREAATRAGRMFTSFIARYQHQIRYVHDAADIILQAMHAAQEAIMHGKDPETETIGETTITGGIVLEVDQDYDENARSSAPFIFVCGTIGDCKAFRICSKTRVCTEITKGNRGSMDVRDPGGCIGNIRPDLRNLVLHTILCDEGDIILMMSDGVHDNMTPKAAGLSPSDLNLTVLNNEWGSLKSDLPISGYMEQKILSLVGADKDKPLDVTTCTRSLIEYCTDITGPLRELYSRPGRFDPNYDWKKYPGKVDHTTCLSYRVGLRGKMSRSDSQSFLERPVRSNSITNLSISPEDPYRDVWDRNYGAGTHAVAWEEFVTQLIPNTSEAERAQIKKIIDNSNTNVVTHYKFTEFMKGFGPQENMIENVMRITNAQWFHGYLSGEYSMRLLEGEPQGTFLIRFSGSRPGIFVLDYVTNSQGKPMSVRLTTKSHQSGGGFTAPGRNHTEIHFPTIHDMVSAYSTANVLRHPFSYRFTSEPWFWGEISAEESDRKLQGKPVGTFLIRFSKMAAHYAASFVGPPQDGTTVRKGLISKTPGGGFQVESSGQVFETMEDLVGGYQASGHFSQPLTHV